MPGTPGADVQNSGRREHLTTGPSANIAMTCRWYVALSDRDLTTQARIRTTCIHGLRPIGTRKSVDRATSAKPQPDRWQSCQRGRSSEDALRQQVHLGRIAHRGIEDELVHPRLDEAGDDVLDRLG